MKSRVSRVASLGGEIRPPSDKSLTHRAYMLGAIASGRSVIRKPLRGEDCESTLRCLGQMGLEHLWLDESSVVLMPAEEWATPTDRLDCGNSGTTMRLLSGLIASRPIAATLVGDESLSRRPMGRIAEPLRRMGAHVEGDQPPIRVIGDDLAAINYELPIASAQVKSCVLLAGLRASGITCVVEPEPSRDHTERMLLAAGVEVGREGRSITLEGGQIPEPFEFSVPGDISSAAFFMVAAACLPDAWVLAREVGINPTRTGILDVFSQCGIEVLHGLHRELLGEPVTDFEVRFREGKQPFHIEGALVPRLIDEIPVLAILATQCDGTSVIRGAKELRAKETDRIESVASGLRAMGAQVETFDDGLAVTGPVRLKGSNIEAFGDHRIAMAFTIAGLMAEGDTWIHGSESIATSFPDFETTLQRLCLV